MTETAEVVWCRVCGSGAFQAGTAECPRCGSADLDRRSAENPGCSLCDPFDGDDAPCPHSDEERAEAEAERKAAAERERFLEWSPPPGMRLSALALAREVAAEHGELLQAEVVNGRVRWWIRPRSGGIFTPQYAASGVWGKVRQTAERLGLTVSDRDVEATIKELAALLPRRPVTAEPKFLTLSDLLAAEQTEPRWVVPGFLSEGLTLLAGRPKTGKSFLVLDLLTGEKLFSKLPVDLAGGALYLALEDTERRLANRLQLFASQGGVAVDRPVEFVTAWSAAGDGGLDALENWLREHPGTRLVVVDTLGKLRGHEGSGEYNYQADVMMMDPLKQLADRHHLALVVVHHTRKSDGDSDDPLDAISGTLGLAGTADAAFVLTRKGDSATLAGRGRDLAEDLEWGLKRDGVRWKLAATGDPVRELFRANPGRQYSSSQVEAETGVSKATVNRRLEGLVAETFVVKTGHGRATRYLHWPGVSPG